MRLDRLLSEMGFGSRREVKVFIKKGQVRINDVVSKDIGKNVQTADTVTVDGEPVNYSEFQYYLLNKPADYLSATEDKHGQLTVMDLLDDNLPHYQDLAPVGRLDQDTTGLLLITNDGQLAHHLLQPKFHVAKTYEALVDGVVADELVEIFAAGIKLSDFTTQPAKLEIVERDDEKKQSRVLVTIAEGKYHQVKRMLGVFDHNVIDLQRVKFGPLRLDEDLGEGEFRPLTDAEIAALKAV
ncbi:pseudouridine synthase [Lapidilactobacillus mulanensis]|uniref:Pseudouridine synthase n=1 Tax=Lapidilactobacillus mulanensis TaxID=2485999 RepID=A0ABW4DMS3_9LACO|nr:pseudouridine synthase [Lapidilactobacillus mulanensis]